LGFEFCNLISVQKMQEIARLYLFGQVTKTLRFQCVKFRAFEFLTFGIV